MPRSPAAPLPGSLLGALAPLAALALAGCQCETFTCLDGSSSEVCALGEPQDPCITQVGTQTLLYTGSWDLDAVLATSDGPGCGEEPQARIDATASMSQESGEVTSTLNLEEGQFPGTGSIDATGLTVEYDVLVALFVLELDPTSPGGSTTTGTLEVSTDLSGGCTVTYDVTAARY